MFPWFLLIVLWLGSGPAAAQAVEKQLVVSITAQELKGGLVSELTWDGGLLVLQGAFVSPTGEIKAEYLVVPAEGTELKRLDVQSAASTEYWKRKSNRLSPTGLGRIELSQDAQMPAYGVGSLERRLSDAVNMGGMQHRHLLKLGPLVMLERISDEPPYDGETWSWSPATLNRVAYVDGKGDLWAATADGRQPRRLLRGSYTLPAWSDDGRLIAIAERKSDGQRWDISVVHLPEALSAPPR